MVSTQRRLPPSPPSSIGPGFTTSDTTVVEPEPIEEIAAKKNLLTHGQVLNDAYEIRRVLGRGGMGQVYEAHDRLLNRSVAIKVPWPKVGHEPLAHEAQALAAMHGQGVPNVYALGKHGDIHYCVMERVYGRTLAAYMVQRFADGIFTIAEAVDILIGVADALTGVHAAGLIHRDLKPSNIMLAPGNRVVLLDFGLFLTERRAGDESIICGSPRYIAPEVITANLRSGQAHLIDVYALGVIAFMLLSGYAPFDDPSVTRLLSKHVNQTPPALHQLRPDIPKKLSRIIGQMMAKVPEERTFSAEAVVSSLSAVRDRLRAEQTSSGRRPPRR